MSVVSVRLVGEEPAVRQVIEELTNMFGGRLDIAPMRNRKGGEWVALGTLLVHDGVTQHDQPQGVPSSHGSPVFEEAQRVRVRSTGRTGKVAAVVPTTGMIRQRGEWWRYIIEFDDGQTYSYLAYALEPVKL